MYRTLLFLRNTCICFHECSVLNYKGKTLSGEKMKVVIENKQKEIKNKVQRKK